MHLNEVIQIFLGIILTFGMFILKGLRSDLNEVGKELKNVNEKLLTIAVNKLDFETYRRETREAIHDLRNKMTDYEKRLYEIKIGKRI